MKIACQNHFSDKAGIGLEFNKKSKQESQDWLEFNCNSTIKNNSILLNCKSSKIQESLVVPEEATVKCLKTDLARQSLKVRSFTQWIYTHSVL